MAAIRPFCVGLTGGIGSGKSVAAEGFVRLGAQIIDTDVIAHELTGPGGAAMAEIKAAFGDSIETASGALDRAAMRARAFADVQARKSLEAILHPMIRAESERRLALATQSYVLLIVPLLVENLSAYRPLLDRILVVDCEVSQQRERVAARSGLALDQVNAILSAQASRTSRLQVADDVIHNQGDLISLNRQVERLHGEYMKHATGEF